MTDPPGLPPPGADGAAGPLADAVVRGARVSDAAAVGVVQAAVFTGAYAGLLAPEVLAGFAPALFAAVWRASLADPPSASHVLLVACAADVVVGFAAVGPAGDPDLGPESAELLVGGVHPDARLAGHGSRLANAAADTAGSAGFSELVVWLLASDEATRAFLQAAGFAPDSAYRDRVVSEDGWLAREVRLRVRAGRD